MEKVGYKYSMTNPAEKNPSPVSAGLFSGLSRMILPRRNDLTATLRLFLLVLVGGILLSPLMARLPVLGWDWYFFFTGHHPVINIDNPGSPFLPYTKWLLMTLTWLPWRNSLALLGGLTFMSVALGTWKYGGRYGSIALALLNPVPLFVLWVGHPDGLALLGMLTNIIPLALIKPQVTIWSFLRSRAHIFWLAVTLGLVFLIWPNWLSTPLGIHWDHSSSFGWQALGWPLLAVGVVLLAGAGSDPWRLMAAGCLLSPDLMPYHLVVLLPAIGRVKGWWKLVVWLAAWLVLLGMGLAGSFRFLNLLLPLFIYAALQTPRGYLETLLGHMERAQRFLRYIRKPGRVFGN